MARWKFCRCRQDWDCICSDPSANPHLFLFPIVMPISLAYIQISSHPNWRGMFMPLDLDLVIERYESLALQQKGRFGILFH